MAEEGNGRRSVHKDCEHENTKWARRKCRNLRLHADCDHGDNPAAVRACAIRRKKLAEVSVDDLVNALAQ